LQLFALRRHSFASMRLLLLSDIGQLAYPRRAYRTVSLSWHSRRAAPGFPRHQPPAPAPGRDAPLSGARNGEAGGWGGQPCRGRVAVSVTQGANRVGTSSGSISSSVPVYCSECDVPASTAQRVLRLRGWRIQDRLRAGMDVSTDKRAVARLSAFVLRTAKACSRSLSSY
jgi:hypothetical protein